MLVPNDIRIKPCRKILINKLSFRQIATLSDTPSVSFSDLLSTVSLYFGYSTEFTEREAQATAISIHNIFLLFSNLQSVAFSNLNGKSLTISNFAHCPADLTYFTFRSIVSAAAIDFRVPTSSLFLEFSFR